MAVEYVHDPDVIRITFSGAITSADLIEVAGYLIDLEARMARAPDRLVDLGPSTTLAINFGDIANLTHLRQAAPLANPIRTALVAHSAAQQGYARMFQTLNDHPSITVAVFADEASARAWLRGG